jgi:hypothetical protein
VMGRELVEELTDCVKAIPRLLHAPSMREVLAEGVNGLDLAMVILGARQLYKIRRVPRLACLSPPLLHGRWPLRDARPPRTGCGQLEPVAPSAHRGLKPFGVYPHVPLGRHGSMIHRLSAAV